MKLTSADRVCCPPPLFHCFGLVLGLLSAITHGSAFVIPCDVYNPEVTIEAAFQERCTVLHGVPTMFSAQLQAARKEGKIEWNGLRTGIAAGSPVPRQLMEDVRSVFNLNSLLNVYGNSKRLQCLQVKMQLTALRYDRNISSKFYDIIA
jgi:acyl-CoA synthetase (AMP-forming)/AMP-acid ligase II